MRLWLIGVFLIAVASKPSDSQQEECAIPGLDSYINKKENASTAVLTNVQTVATSVVPGLSNELGSENANSSDLYDALTITLNVTDSSSFQTFEGALQQITDAYFLACYGEENQKPTEDDLIPALQNLLLLLDALSTDNTDEELAMIREYFGEISCLIDTYGYDNLLPTDSGPTDSGPTNPDGGTSSPTSPPVVVNCSDLASVTVQAFYVCIVVDDIGPIFGLGYTPLPLQPDQSKRCVGFVVDTSGSMGDEIVEVRNNIKNFIDSQETLPACYVLIDFNDYGSPNPSDNVGTAKVYDPSIEYGSQGSNLVRTGDLPVFGVLELKDDVDALFPSGGGDCPEFGMTGILETLQAINTIQGLILPEQGNLHHLITLTDASAKDDYLYQEVIDAANDAKATVHFFYSGSGCYGTFGNYETVRLETGGIAVTSFDDFDALSEFIQLYDTAVEANSGLSRRKRSDDLFSEAAPSHTVYLNYLTDNLAILAQTTQPNVIIDKPDGQQVILPVSGVLALYTDDAPVPGLWTIRVSTGILQVVISAPTLLQLDITYTTTDENGELVPTQDIPYACETGTILVTSSQFSKISSDYPLYLNLLDSTGNIIEQAELTECSGFHSVVVTFPNSPLVFYQLQGHDIGGNPFSKTISDYDVTFRPPNLQASLLNAYEIAVNPGNTSFSKLELHYNQSHGGELNLVFTITASSSDLVTYYLDAPQSVNAGDKVYAVFETQASVNVVPGTSGYYVTASITESCTGSALDFVFQVVSYQPVPLAVSNTTQTSNDRNLKISWQEPIISIGDDIWQYTVYFDYNNGTYWQVDVDSTVLEYILIGLQPYQLVYVVVEAKSAANVILAKTPQFQFWSKEDVPGPVALLTYTTTGSTTVSVQWDPPTLPNGVILYYVVKLVDVANANELNSSYVDALKDKIVTYKHLEAYIRYEIVVVGATSEGLGQSQQNQFYTIQGKPQSYPLNIRIRAITTTSANISWDPPSFQDRQGFIIRYNITISYNDQSGQQKVKYFYTYEEDDTSIIVEDLPQYAKVSAELSSATVNGDGPVSPPTPGVLELPPSAPPSLTARPAGSSSVSLTWLPPENPNGILLGYSVFFRTEDSADQTDQNFQELRISLDQLEDVNSPSTQVDGLASPATHSFYVSAYNSAGNGEETEQTSVTLTDNTWIIILCGVMGTVVIITVLVVCCICCICCCCCCMKRGEKSEKQGDFVVFHNEGDQDEKSATNPAFEVAGAPDNVYEDMDKVLEETKMRADPPYHTPARVTFAFQQELHNKSAANPMYEHSNEYYPMNQLPANPVFARNKGGPVDESATGPVSAHYERGPVDESATNPGFGYNQRGPVDESVANPVFALEGNPVDESATIERGPVDESAANPAFAHEGDPVDESATTYPEFECNEGDSADESATELVFGLGDPDDGYTDTDQLLPTDKDTPERMPCQEMESELEKKRKPRKMGLKETMSEFEKGWKLKQVPQKKTEAQLEMERILKTVPDKIDHFEDIITKIGGTVASGQTAAALQDANPAAFQAANPAALEVANPAALEAANPAALQTANPAALEASNPAPLAAGNPAALQAANTAVLQTADPAALQAANPAALQAVNTAALQAANPAALQTANPAAFQAASTATLEAANSAALQTANPAALQIANPAPLQAANPAALQAANPAPLQAANPTALQAANSAALQAINPATLQATNPAPLQAANPAAFQTADPAALRAPNLAALRAPNPSAFQTANPAPLQAANPAALRAANPAPLQAANPAAFQTADPAALRAPNPAALRAPNPAAFQTANPAAFQAPNPAAFQTANPAAFQAPNPAAFQTANPAALQAPNPAAFQTANPAAFQAPNPAAFQTANPAALQAPNPAAFWAPNPAAFQTADPAAFRAPNPAAFRAPNPAAFRAPNPAAFRAPNPAAFQTANPAALQTSNTAAYVNVGGNALVNVTSHQSQQQ